MFKTVEQLTEKTYGDAARHDVELAKAKKKLEKDQARLKDLEARRDALKKKRFGLDNKLKKEQQLNKQADAGATALAELAKVKTEILSKMRQQIEAIDSQVTSCVNSRELDSKCEELREAANEKMSKKRDETVAKEEMIAVERKRTAQLGHWYGDLEPALRTQLEEAEDKRCMLERKVCEVKCDLKSCDVAGLEKQLAEAVSLLEDKEAASADLSKAIEAKKSSLSELNRRCAQLKNKLEEALRAKDDVNSELSGVNRLKEEYHQQLQALKATKEELTVAVATQEAQERELNEVKESIHAKNTALFDLECQVTQLQEADAEAAKIKEANQARKLELEAASAELDTRSHGLDQRLAFMHEQVTSTRKDNSQLGVICEGLEAKIKGKREHLADKSARNTALEAELKNLTETLAHTDKMVAVNKAALDEQPQTESEFGEMDAEVKTLEKKLADQKSSFATFDENLGLMMDELREQCNGKINELDAENQQVEGKIATLNAQASNLKAELEKAPQDIESRLKELAKNEEIEIEKAVADVWKETSSVI